MEVKNLTYRKSTYSSNGGANCVECGIGGQGMILVRDTADRDGGSLAFSAAVWSAFLGSVK